MGRLNKRIILKVAKEVRSCYFKADQRADGCCGVVSRRLQIALRAIKVESIIIQGYFRTRYHRDRRRKIIMDHVWLEINGLILDATASQFEEVKEEHIILDKYDNRPNYCK